ncbi:septum formation family protein [Nocardioides campestrisoli]|uniref:septum formation family protein n=1 Tax=Nocardioides campestrisoli TaxID=2736757 RepID=UPI00163DB1FA|nr:septum formation family protein [Nocardioides campestrisoli]
MRGALPSLACAVALALVGCTSGGGDSSPSEPSESRSSSSSPSAAPPETPSAAPARPRAGRCYRLDSREALASAAEAPPVSCRSAHTAVTYSTGFLELDPADPAGALDSPRVRRQVAPTCQRRLARFLGGSLEQRRLSLLTRVWFTPSPAQVEQGARWFRCDVIAAQSDDRLLALPRPNRLRGILRAPGPRNAFATCGTARPGTPAFRRVACSRRHSWRAVASVSLGQGAYPPRAQIFRRMDPRCTAAARARARNKFSFTWAEERPTRAQWSAGRRYGLCWTAVQR